MTSCSGGLLLLLVLCSVEVARALPRGDKADIDIAKCVATRKDQQSYTCVMAKDCIKDAHYVQVPEQMMPRPKREPPPTTCVKGYTIRPISKTKWEMEVKYIQQRYATDLPAPPSGYMIFGFVFKPREPPLQFSKIEFTTLKKYIETDQLRSVRDEASGNFKKIVEIVKPTTTVDGSIYVRFELELHTTEFSEFEQVTFDHIDLGFAKFVPPAALLNPCSDLTNVVLPRAPFNGRFRTKMPDVNFTHNVYDFAAMCPTNYRPFLIRAHGGGGKYDKDTQITDWKEIASIECALKTGGTKQTELQLVLVDREEEKHDVVPHKTFRDAATKKPDYVEVTCKLEEDICFYCGKPAWTADTPPNGHAKMVYTPGARWKGTGFSPCPTLKCPAGHLPFFPQINFTGRELPDCRQDLARYARDSMDDYGVQFKPLGACMPLPAETHACPKGLPGFESCFQPILKDDQYECSSSSEFALFAAPTRRSVLTQIGTTYCDMEKGRFVMKERKYPDENAEDRFVPWQFTDESWLVCRRIRLRAPFDIYKSPEHPVWLRALVGAGYGFVAYLVVIAIMLLLRFPINAYRDKYFMTAITKPEDKLQEPDLTLLNAKLSGFNPLAYTPGVKMANPLEDVATHKNLSTVHARTVDAAVKSGKSGSGKGGKHHVGEDDTCIEPDDKEIEALVEADRLAECTEEEDQTGKEVDEIGGEGGSEKKKRLLTATAGSNEQNPKPVSKKEAPKEEKSAP